MILEEGMEKSGHKKALRGGELSGENGNRTDTSAFLAAQVVVQVFVAGIAAGFVTDVPVIHPGNGFHCLLSGKVVVEVTVDMRVPLQVRQRLFQVADRIHHEVVAGRVDTDGIVARLFQGQVRQEIHEALEYADVALDLAPQMSYQGYVLVLDTPLVVGVAHLVTAGDIAERQRKVASLA